MGITKEEHRKREREKQKRWSDANPERRKEIKKRTYEKNKAKSSARERERLREARHSVIQHYGPTCKCCGEDREPFLVVDHIEGGGAQHRREYKIKSLALWLVRNGLPPGFQILCANCNMAKERVGGCPHQQWPPTTDTVTSIN